MDQADQVMKKISVPVILLPLLLLLDHHSVFADVAACGCYCGKVLRPPCGDEDCKRACGWRGPAAAAPSYVPPAYDYAAEQQREEEEARQRQAEREEQARKEVEESKRRKAEFEQKKEDALRSMKGIAENELGLKGVSTDSGLGLKGVGADSSLGLKGVGETKTADLGLKGVGETASPVPVAQVVNPQIAKIMKGIQSIEVPPPLSQKDVDLSWDKLSLGKNPDEILLQIGDIELLAWDLAGKLGSKALLPHCKVLMIAGKTFIAGEDGAYVYLMKQDKVYEDALQYLKNPATSKRFAELVRDIKEGRYFLSLDDPNMVKAARAVVDPKLGSSGMALAWDSMLSPEAKAAMVRKACLEIGTELVSTGTEGLVSELTKRKELYEAARLNRKEAQRLLKQTTDPSAKEQLRKAIEETGRIMENTYRLEKAGSGVAGTLEGIYVQGEAEKIKEK